MRGGWRRATDAIRKNDPALFGEVSLGFLPQIQIALSLLVGERTLEVQTSDRLRRGQNLPRKGALRQSFNRFCVRGHRGTADLHPAGVEVLADHVVDEGMRPLWIGR